LKSYFHEKVDTDAGVKHVKSFKDGRHELFTGSKLSQKEIDVKLGYIQNDDAKLELVWSVEVKITICGSNPRLNRKNQTKKKQQ